MKTLSRILIVRTDRIGDVILTLPLVTALRRQFPSVEISMLISSYTSDIVHSYSENIEVIFYDHVPFFQMVRLFREKKFDAAVIVKPSWRLALLFFFVQIPIRVGTGYRLYSFLFNKKVYEHRKNGNKHELEYNLNLLSPLGVVSKEKIFPQLVVDEVAKDKVQKLLQQKHIFETDSLVILHPGSGGSSRNWHWKNFGLLGKQIGEIPNTKLLVSGGKNERELLINVSKIIGEKAILLDETLSLKEFIALLSLGKLFISNSTGPLHLAVAVGSFVVGFFPQIPHLSSTRWGPYTENKIEFSPNNKPIDCNNCISVNECECMNSISVEEVFEKIKSKLQNSNGR
ncbi:MAG: glycosyltransferase family 9 protein [Ignavibacteria bacterium]|nr:glycosyltransferase family 9 protein [Ignavibacteria bacterium]